MIEMRVPHKKVRSMYAYKKKKPYFDINTIYNPTKKKKKNYRYMKLDVIYTQLNLKYRCYTISVR